MWLIRQITTTREAVFQEGVRSGGEVPSALTELAQEREVLWRGFGGCLNEAGIAALDALPPERKKHILDELFLPDKMGLNYCR